MPLDESKLNKLDRVLTLLDAENTLTKEDFVKYFEQILKLVVGIQEQQAKAIQSLEQTYSNLLSKMNVEHSGRFKELKGQVNDLFVGDQLKRMDGEMKMSASKMQKMINEMLDKKVKEMDGRMKRVRDGQQGPPGPIGPMGPVGTFSPQQVEEINKIKEDLDRIDKRPRVIAGPSANSVLSFDVTSQVNGSATSFTVPMHRQALMLIGSQAPFIYRPTTDFTTANTTLTMTVQVETIVGGQTLIFLYVK